MSLSDLADHVVATHHAKLRRDMARALELADQAMRENGRSAERLSAVAEILRPFAAEVELHMTKEEQVLFPLVQQLERAASHQRCYPGPVEDPIAELSHEHRHAIEAMDALRHISDDFTAPRGASHSHAQLLQLLAEMDSDLRIHTHLEDEVLFPAARALVRESAQQAGGPIIEIPGERGRITRT